MRALRRACAVLALLAAAATPAAAQTGTITGRVSDAQNQRPLAGAQVQAAGRTTVTNAQGDYTLAVPAGPVTVRAATLGYATQTRTVTVSANTAAVTNFALEAQSVLLDDLVVTALGITREERE